MKTKNKYDQALSRLYKKDAKQTSPSEIDKKILEYAANKVQEKNSKSYFSGSWKVPLSLAASVAIVFAIIMQINQMPGQLDIPPLPQKEEESKEFNHKIISPESGISKNESLLFEKKKNQKKHMSTQNRSSSAEPVGNTLTIESPTQKQKNKFNVNQNMDTSNLPVKDWLLLIEQLIAKKDYAEASRQLNKFKQVHTKVNVEDLEKKIP